MAVQLRGIKYAWLRVKYLLVLLTEQVLRTRGSPTNLPEICSDSVVVGQSGHLRTRRVDIVSSLDLWTAGIVLNRARKAPRTAHHVLRCCSVRSGAHFGSTGWRGVL
jgi:hypothetical protein